MTTQLSPAQAYLTAVAQHADPEIRKAYNLIPEVFINQVFTQGKACNYLDSTLVSDSQYNNMSAGGTDFFRVELVDGTITPAGDPAFKIRLVGKMNRKTYQMVPMLKGALPNPDEPWLSNFRSDLYAVTKQDVENGIVDAADYNTLLEYCKVWQTVGQSNMYTAEHKNNRLSFVARNNAFLLTFQIQIRPNTNPNRKPGTPLWTPGITSVAWNNVHLFHRQTGTAVNSISVAGAVDTHAPAPVVNRTVIPQSMGGVPAGDANVGMAPARTPFG